MVLIRCPDHPPDGRFHEWVAAVEPVGYPDTALLCSERTHADSVPGLAYLTDAEYGWYQHGQRVFGLTGSATRIELTDRVHALDPVTLPRPPEPSPGELGRPTEGSDAEVDAGRIKQRVQSYLWSDHWKDELAPHGLTWQAFLSETSAVTPVVEEWAAGGRSWDDVLDRFAAELDADLE